MLGKTEIVLILAQEAEFFQFFVEEFTCVVGYKNLNDLESRIQSWSIRKTLITKLNNQQENPEILPRLIFQIF